MQIKREVMRIKEDFHKLIDEIEDEQVLKEYYELIQKLNRTETGKLWKNLTDQERKELMVSYEESLDPKNLIGHKQVKNEHAKWLKK